ncbi:hypothetical protein [Caulobacter sp. DWR1-3-2b1]|uniref:hypothetical protein n=1 Tax=Caulobacter sp. DWR1-3-2b1 TaxID=2804670 RepID=UPI003CE73025
MVMINVPLPQERLEKISAMQRLVDAALAGEAGTHSMSDLLAEARRQGNVEGRV